MRALAWRCGVAEFLGFLALGRGQRLPDAADLDAIPKNAGKWNDSKRLSVPESLSAIDQKY